MSFLVRLFVCDEYVCKREMGYVCVCVRERTRKLTRHECLLVSTGSAKKEKGKEGKSKWQQIGPTEERKARKGQSGLWTMADREEESGCHQSLDEHSYKKGRCLQRKNLAIHTASHDRSTNKTTSFPLK